jgi:hypothetical protein
MLKEIIDKSNQIIKYRARTEVTMAQSVYLLGYGLNHQRIWLRIQAGVKIPALSTASTPNQPPIKYVVGTVSSGAK